MTDPIAEFFAGLRQGQPNPHDYPKVPRDIHCGMSCYHCEGRGLIRGEKTRIYNEGDRTLTFYIPVFVCPGCFGEGIMPDDMKHLRSAAQMVYMEKRGR